MAKYDGLIIPRSYNDYINKSDPAGVAQALQLTGVMDNAPTAQSTKPAKSGGIFAANAVIMANNKTLSGVAISTGSVVRVLFTAALTGSDATTGLTLTYNGNTYAVKVGKNGALANFLANNIDGSYIYCQAYTTLELMFDGSQFIIMGNPVVISSADYTIYTDGSTKYTKAKEDEMQLWNEVIGHSNFDDANKCLQQGKVTVDAIYNAVNGFGNNWGLYVSISLSAALRGIQLCLRYSDGAIGKRSFDGTTWSSWSAV